MGIKLEEITEEQFKKYEITRQEGKYNMFDPNAIAESGLNKNIYLSIMKYYSMLDDKFPHIRSTKWV